MKLTGKRKTQQNIIKKFIRKNNRNNFNKYASRMLYSLLLTLLLINNFSVSHASETMDKESVIIGLTGDVMIGRLVNKVISTTSYEYPWGNLLPLLNKTDLNLINLETTLTSSINAVPKVFNFKSDPENVESLKRAKIDVVTLANNHILDFGIEGLEDTLQALGKAGIQHVGAGLNIEEAKKPVIMDIKNTTIGIIGYTDNEPTWKATATKPGTNYVYIGDHSTAGGPQPNGLPPGLLTKFELKKHNFSDLKYREVIREIIKLKRKVDILIFTIHWGPNMVQHPTIAFQRFARVAIDAGVDILHGHSAHVFQGIEIYKNKVIFYDAGDFIDDYYVTPSLRNDRSFLFLVEVNKEGIKGIQLVPVLISRMQVNKAKGKDYVKSMAMMKSLSRAFGTTIAEKGTGVFVELND